MKSIITNADGTAVVPENFFAGGSANIYIRVEMATNGLKSITAAVR